LTLDAKVICDKHLNRITTKMFVADACNKRQRESVDAPQNTTRSIDFELLGLHIKIFERAVDDV